MAEQLITIVQLTRLRNEKLPERVRSSDVIISSILDTAANHENLRCEPLMFANLLTICSDF